MIFPYSENDSELVVFINMSRADFFLRYVPQVFWSERITKNL